MMLTELDRWLAANAYPLGRKYVRASTATRWRDAADQEDAIQHGVRLLAAAFERGKFNFDTPKRRWAGWLKKKIWKFATREWRAENDRIERAIARGEDHRLAEWRDVEPASQVDRFGEPFGEEWDLESQTGFALVEPGSGRREPGRLVSHTPEDDLAAFDHYDDSETEKELSECTFQTGQPHSEGDTGIGSNQVPTRNDGERYGEGVHTGIGHSERAATGIRRDGPPPAPSSGRGALLEVGGAAVPGGTGLRGAHERARIASRALVLEHADTIVSRDEWVGSVYAEDINFERAFEPYRLREAQMLRAAGYRTGSAVWPAPRRVPRFRPLLPPRQPGEPSRWGAVVEPTDAPETLAVIGKYSLWALLQVECAVMSARGCKHGEVSRGRDVCTTGAEDVQGCARAA